MDISTEVITADLLHAYADAVVPRDHYMVLEEVGWEGTPITYFSIDLNPGCSIPFKPVNDGGDLGAVLYFQEVDMPRPCRGVYDLDVINRQPHYCSHALLCDTEADDHLAVLLLAQEDVDHIEVGVDENHGEGISLVYVSWNL